MDQEFKPGIYRHYKGGFYTALMIVAHHETNLKFVVYVSNSTGSLHLRELATPGADSWNDQVTIPDSEGGQIVQRFQYVSPA